MTLGRGSNKDVYPVTADLEEKLRGLISGSKVRNLNQVDLANAASEYLGEYEHGSVDIEDLVDLPSEGETEEERNQIRRLRLEITRDVLVDFIGMIIATEGQ